MTIRRGKDYGMWVVILLTKPTRAGAGECAKILCSIRRFERRFTAQTTLAKGVCKRRCLPAPFMPEERCLPTPACRRGHRRRGLPVVLRREADHAHELRRVVTRAQHFVERDSLAHVEIVQTVVHRLHAVLLSGLH